jgi:hypothetical protein
VRSVGQEQEGGARDDQELIQPRGGGASSALGYIWAPLAWPFGRAKRMTVAMSVIAKSVESRPPVQHSAQW